MREAPSLTIVPMMQERGANVSVYDPQGRLHGEDLLPGVTWAADSIEAARDADAVVILTEWNEFRALDLARLRGVMRGNALVDLRNIFKREDAESAGFSYDSIGRPGALQTAQPSPAAQPVPAETEDA